jgi:YebC/PmpR family DNA-binding regulatory protein
MSGHSKWSKVKHQKATTDAVKSSAFTKASKAITVAVREGGGVANPEMNFKLRLAVEKARLVNMPKENIERAIAKGKGEGGEIIEEIIYEAYGPHGVALLISTATDKRQRTVSAVKNILDRHGGVLAAPGAVSYQFKSMGIILIQKLDSLSFDHMFSLSLEAGAEDVIERTDVYEIYTTSTTLFEVQQKLQEKHIAIESAHLIMHPTLPIQLNENAQDSVETLIDILKELDDVQEVYSNIE